MNDFPRTLLQINVYKHLLFYSGMVFCQHPCFSSWSLFWRCDLPSRIPYQYLEKTHSLSNSLFVCSVSHTRSYIRLRSCPGPIYTDFATLFCAVLSLFSYKDLRMLHHIPYIIAYRYNSFGLCISLEKGPSL